MEENIEKAIEHSKNNIKTFKTLSVLSYLASEKISVDHFKYINKSENQTVVQTLKELNLVEINDNSLCINVNTQSAVLKYLENNNQIRSSLNSVNDFLIKLYNSIYEDDSGIRSSKELIPHVESFKDNLEKLCKKCDSDLKNIIKSEYLNYTLKILDWYYYLLKAHKKEKRAIETRLDLKEEEHKTIKFANNLKELALADSQLEQYQSADRQFERSHSIFIEKKEIKSKEYIGVLIGWGQNMSKMGSYEAAEELLKKALKLTKKLYADDFNEISTIYRYRANNFRFRKNYKKAESLYKKAVELSTKKLGQNHIVTVNTLLDWANNDSEKGDRNKAINKFRSVHSAFDRIYGSDHDRTKQIATEVEDLEIALDNEEIRPSEIPKIKSNFSSDLKKLQKNNSSTKKQLSEIIKLSENSPNLKILEVNLNDIELKIIENQKDANSWKRKLDILNSKYPSDFNEKMMPLNSLIKEIDILLTDVHSKKNNLESVQSLKEKYSSFSEQSKKLKDEIQSLKSKLNSSDSEISSIIKIYDKMKEDENEVEQRLNEIHSLGDEIIENDKFLCKKIKSDYETNCFTYNIFKNDCKQYEYLSSLKDLSNCLDEFDNELKILINIDKNNLATVIRSKQEISSLMNKIDEQFDENSTIDGNQKFRLIVQSIMKRKENLIKYSQKQIEDFDEIEKSLIQKFKPDNELKWFENSESKISNLKSAIQKSGELTNIEGQISLIKKKFTERQNSYEILRTNSEPFDDDNSWNDLNNKFENFQAEIKNVESSIASRKDEIHNDKTTLSDFEKWADFTKSLIQGNRSNESNNSLQNNLNDIQLIQSELQENIRRVEQIKTNYDSNNVNVKSVEDKLKSIQDSIEELKHQTDISHSYSKFQEESKNTMKSMKKLIISMGSKELGIDLKSAKRDMEEFKWDLAKINECERNLIVLKELRKKLTIFNFGNTNEIAEIYANIKIEWKRLKDISSKRKSNLEIVIKYYEIYDKIENIVTKFIDEISEASAEISESLNELSIIELLISKYTELEKKSTIIVRQIEMLQTKSEEMISKLADDNSNLRNIIDDVIKPSKTVLQSIPNKKLQLESAKSYFEEYNHSVLWIKKIFKKMSKLTLATDIDRSDAVIDSHDKIKIDLNKERENIDRIIESGENLINEENFLSEGIEKSLEILNDYFTSLEKTWDKRRDIYFKHNMLLKAEREISSNPENYKKYMQFLPEVKEILNKYEQGQIVKDLYSDLMTTIKRSLDNVEVEATMKQSQFEEISKSLPRTLNNDVHKMQEQFESFKDSLIPKPPSGSGYNVININSVTTGPSFSQSNLDNVLFKKFNETDTMPSASTLIILTVFVFISFVFYQI